MKKYLLSIAAGLFFAAPVWAGEIQYDISLDGITCPFCVATSERALAKIDGVRLVSGDLETGIIRVCADDSVKFTDAQLTKLFLKKGFTYRGMSVSNSCDNFENSTVLSEEEMDAKIAKHAAMGHGDEDENADWYETEDDHGHEGHNHDEDGHDHQDDETL